MLHVNYQYTQKKKIKNVLFAVIMYVHKNLFPSLYLQHMVEVGSFNIFTTGLFLTTLGVWICLKCTQIFIQFNIYIYDLITVLTDV